jgi:hypothetical protein
MRLATNDSPPVLARRVCAPPHRFVNAHVLLLASVPLIAPLLIFAAVLPAAAMIVLALGAALCSYALVFGWRAGPLLGAPLDLRVFALCMGAGAVLCLLGGEYHIFFAPSDWFTRDAVLADLVRNGFPVFYRFRDVDYVLRAPLGMYAAPALVGHLLGLGAAHLALLIQNALLLGATLFLLSLIVEGAKARVIALVIFFSPVDIVPRVAVDYMDSLKTGDFVLDPLTMFWNPLLNYWGNIPSLFWAPNHALAGWLAATLYLLRRRHEIDIAVLGLCSVMLLFWSPLAMIGAQPFLLWEVGVSLSRSGVATRRNALALAAAVGLVPMIAYLKMDPDGISQSWMFLKSGFWTSYLLLLLFSLAPAWIVLLGWNLTPRWLRAPLALAIAMLIIMPFYRVGASDLNNDFAMRCTIAPLFLLSLGFGELVSTLLDGKGALRLAAITVATLAAVTGLMEIRRALSDPAYTPSDCNLLTATEKTFAGFTPTNYLARLSAAPAWLVRDTEERLAPEHRKCWPGYPLVPNL